MNAHNRLIALEEAVHQAEQKGDCVTTASTPEWVHAARIAIKLSKEGQE